MGRGRFQERLAVLGHQLPPVTLYGQVTGWMNLVHSCKGIVLAWIKDK